MPRRYTKRQKITAIIAAEVTSAAAAGEAQGIPESTLRGWLDDPKLAGLRTKTREDLASEAHVMAQLVLAQIKVKLPEYEARDLSILYGIMIDKAQLLGGQATNRTETKDITSRFSDHEMDMLADAIDDEIKRRDTVPA
jgi:hypothetical protein